MILQEEKVDVKTSGEFQSKEMQISPEFFNKMIWHVILQYKYKIRTSLQEIISNAIDAQVEAGNASQPLKIQLPTRLEPTFKLRDFGTGMTPEVIDKIYTNMGASGSSHTNEKKGGFGIGGKSPLGFTDQYTIRTIVDGTEWQYIAHKNENNGISVPLVKTSKTDEPNGTEIQIPVKPDQIGRFKEGACRATMFWENQPEFNLPEEELFQAKNAMEIGQGVKMYGHDDLGNIFKEGGYYSQSKILLVVDGIPYEIDPDMIRKVSSLNKLNAMLRRESVLTIEAANGAVKILQTRESLEDCEYTLKELEKIGQDALTKVEKFIETHSKKPTLLETVEANMEIAGKFAGNSRVEFEGFRIEGSEIYFPEIKVGKYSIELVEYHFRSKRWGETLKRAKRESEYTQSLNFKMLNKTYLDDLGDSESDVMKSKRLKYKIEDDKDNIYWAKTANMSPEAVKLLEKHFNLPRLSTLELPPKAPKGAKKAAKVLGQGQIDIHVLGHYGSRSVNTLDLSSKFHTTKYVWDDYSDYDNRIMEEAWRRFAENRGFKFCLVAKKYQKEVEANENFVKLSDWIGKQELKDIEVNGVILDAADQTKTTKKLAKIFEKSGDKVLTRYAKRAKLNYGGLIYHNIPTELRKKVREENAEKIKEVSLAGQMLEKLAMKKYPLLKEFSRYDLTRKNTLTYINAVNRRK